MDHHEGIRAFDDAGERILRKLLAYAWANAITAICHAAPRLIVRQDAEPDDSGGLHTLHNLGHLTSDRRGLWMDEPTNESATRCAASCRDRDLLHQFVPRMAEHDIRLPWPMLRIHEQSNAAAGSLTNGRKGR